MKSDTLLHPKGVKPARIRNRAKPYRLIVRKTTRFIAWKPRGGKQESTKETERALAKSFAYRRIAETRPDLARELGIEITPTLKGFNASPAQPSPAQPSPSAQRHRLSA